MPTRIICLPSTSLSLYCKEIRRYLCGYALHVVRDTPGGSNPNLVSSRIIKAFKEYRQNIILSIFCGMLYAYSYKREKESCTRATERRSPCAFHGCRICRSSAKSPLAMGGEIIHALRKVKLIDLLLNHGYRKIHRIIGTRPVVHNASAGALSSPRNLHFFIYQPCSPAR
jgi:hypothetical protein